MKIAIAVRDMQSISGVSFLSRELAHGLAAAGHDVHLLTRKWPSGMTGAVSVTRTSMLPFPSFARAWSYDLFARRKAASMGTDILHGQGDLTQQDVLTVNNVDIAEAFFTGRTEVGSRGTLYIRKRQWDPRRVRQIVAVSRQARSDIEKFYGVPASRVEVIYWGINRARFTPDGKVEARAHLRRTLEIAPDKRIFLSLISGDPQRRNIAGLISAFAKSRLDLNDVLLIVGDIDASRYPEARGLLGKGRLKILPKSAQPEARYKACDFFVLAAHYETFGMTVLEAMATGLPCIVTSRCGVSEIIRDGKNGIVIRDSRDQAALSAAFEKLASTPNLGAQLGAAALDTTKEMDFSNTVKSYVRLYERILAERKGARK